MCWLKVFICANLITICKTTAQQTLQDGTSDFNSYLAKQEHLVMESMANSAKVLADDEHGLPGNLDPYYSYDYEEEHELRPKLVVQKVGKDKQTTTYHPFDDATSTQVPLFTRSFEDYDNDFIIFMNPAFPPGVGHYIVLRKLESQVSTQNDLIDDALSAEISVTLPSQRFYETTEGAQPNFLHEGFVQSGEENYKDINKEDNQEDENSQENSPMNNNAQWQESLKNRRYSPRQRINLNSAQFNVNVNEDSTYAEVVYEAFTITFKESIHGYVSDAEPLELNFMSNYDDGFYQYEDEQGNPQSASVLNDDDVIPEELVDGPLPQIELPPEGQAQMFGSPTGNRRSKRSTRDSERWPRCLKPMLELQSLRSYTMWEKAM
ncbi:unnamed protein product [Orchesella dallaii]|uniref:Uncharacterized protein n=1 Tax=Orchesella dallaii TaxID=48710 RepID=A0ABP1RMZ5_9HEXA